MLSDADLYLRSISNESKVASDLVHHQTAQFLKTLELVSASNLAQVLIALWDNGLYEYVRERGNVRVAAAAVELGLDAEVLGHLIDYLAGRGLMKPDEAGGYVLTEQGQPYWNYLTRGVLTSHVGGYNPMLMNLGPLLRKEVGLWDSRLDRQGRLVALGANYTLSGNGTIQWVIRELGRLKARHVLDLGCGAGIFLLQLALHWPEARGAGVDMNEDAIAEARRLSRDFGLDGRLGFHAAAVSAEPMALDPAVISQTEVITAMYMLHEFGGRGGPEKISEIIASLRRQFPGRKLLLLEGTRADPLETGRAPQSNYAQLDYSFIHPLSRQGPLRTPDEWREIIERAGARLLERIPGFKLVPGWISMYIVGLD